MTNATAVARTLKKAGINTVPDRKREGLHVTGKGRVTLTVQFWFYAHTNEKMPKEIRRLRDDAVEVLEAAGYTVTPLTNLDTDVFTDETVATDETDLYIVTKDA